MKLVDIGIVGLGAYLPETVRGNSEVAPAAGVTAEWIEERTGVLERRTADSGQAASDLAANASMRALRSAGIAPEQVGLVVLGTSTLDELGPATACRVQHQISATSAVAFDVNAACSGFVFGMQIAHDWLVQRGRGRYALVIGVELYSKFLDPTDRGTAVLFADGAGAAVVGEVPPGRGILHVATGSDGSQADQVLIPGGGSRVPASEESLAKGAHTIHMNGRAVRDFITDAFPRVLDETCRAAGIESTELDMIVPHQPNPLLLRHLAEQAGIPPEKTVITGDRVGNVGAASIPVALTHAVAEGRVGDGEYVLLPTFGAGVTWGACLLHWSPPFQLPRSPLDDSYGV
ncbi:ketoacyl-ACP synthase III [Actinopolyspora erythraea]|uniref:3-oxoacyl-ACP synthase n=1 Tax=Actinopolyspora erythraea TaxID=414996 RepID=A0A099D735_9ACTN|nr:ketoacyl-ACP synthase III [Actinopolyspora erythraea]ASU78156.1 ketoacyl-ACP synthase III [Actinopolyspora erythraea]KGI81627.1 3-oxoacyl-ACP synthase [Actinopolyspora erythraea]